MRRNRKTRTLARIASAAAGAAMLVAVAVAQATISPADQGKRIEARNGAVSSANGLASEAGVEAMRAGGNAVDAAVATAFAIGVVEPQMSGLGGSGAAVVWMKGNRSATYLDFYAAQNRESWRGHTAVEQQAAGTTPPRRDPNDLRVVGIPGDVAGLLALHEKFGSLPLDRVLAPAIRLAEQGFPVGHVLSGFIASNVEKLKPFPRAYDLYVPNGKPLPPGATLRNDELAASLKRIAGEGRRGFYEGPTGAAVVATLNAGKNPATSADMASYQPQWKRPLCTDYRGRSVLSAAPPQTGLQVLHTLELLEPFDLKTLGLPTRSAAAFNVLVSALRVGQADAQGNGDPNWVQVPANGIASAAFAAERKDLVGTAAAPRAIEGAAAQQFDRSAPSGDCSRYDPYPAAAAVVPTPPTLAPAADVEGERLNEESGETTHISVVDKKGNAVALTQTNSSVFGSGAFVGGFFLNDSGFRFTDANVNLPSRSAWRVRTTTIAPTIVLKNGDVQMVVGAPGSGRIPTEIVQVMVYTLDYGLDPLDAVKMPRIYPSPRSPSVQLEHGFTPALLGEIRRIGYDPVPAGAEYARLYMIVRRGKSWVGVADTRHDGEARGF